LQSARECYVLYYVRRGVICKTCESRCNWSFPRPRRLLSVANRRRLDLSWYDDMCERRGRRRRRRRRRKTWERPARHVSMQNGEDGGRYLVLPCSVPVRRAVMPSTPYIVPAPRLPHYLPVAREWRRMAGERLANLTSLQMAHHRVSAPQSNAAAIVAGRGAVEPPIDRRPTLRILTCN
jgi:hypothetical protein